MRIVRLGGLLLVLLAAPLAADAQPTGKVPRIGVLFAGSATTPGYDTLRRGLAELGWVEGQNILIEYRYAEGRPERYPALIAELLSLKVDVLVAGGGTPGARAAKQATSTSPSSCPSWAIPSLRVWSRASPGRAGTSPGCRC